MSRILTLLTACSALAVFAGCGSNNDNKSSDTGAAAPAPAQSTPTTTSSGGTSSSGGELEIKMQNFAFSPKDATVKVGQKIKWTNEDDAPHNVTGGELKSKTFGKGGTFEYTADKPEKISYVCTIHPQMTATLTVTK
jgi:plastocyanin